MFSFIKIRRGTFIRNKRSFFSTVVQNKLLRKGNKHIKNQSGIELWQSVSDERLKIYWANIVKHLVGNVVEVCDATKTECNEHRMRK